MPKPSPKRSGPQRWWLLLEFQSVPFQLLLLARSGRHSATHDGARTDHGARLPTRSTSDCQATSMGAAPAAAHVRDRPAPAHDSRRGAPGRCTPRQFRRCSHVADRWSPRSRIAARWPAGQSPPLAQIDADDTVPRRSSSGPRQIWRMLGDSGLGARRGTSYPGSVREWRLQPPQRWASLHYRVSPHDWPFFSSAIRPQASDVGFKVQRGDAP